ncbi:NYN domain-containing protein [Rhodoblastus acidophilus]|jgi:hypothetical protein|uniref:NYN domain-containing protein n=1 Tax=Rhodoblastus acidophilus TaxID=1074 RepID=A0A6N8DRR7_RHOAC|nr:NYN domain-containing protein [Rhodoblastus acidophilus]MCW2275709.1 hypothetical protein [Rhodoblastus acidophilus]MTV31873.1 NYN domain-containing protein [Rhodoblastus acidophilus]
MPASMARIKTEELTARLAVLIDADNAQASVIEGVLADVAQFGDPSVKRIYGDFSSANLSSWKTVLHKHAIKPVQQFAYCAGKNATDSALIIDAMDLLYTQEFDGFCLVTSDSDFAGLATRLKEGGKKVYGFGKRQTPEAFRNACHTFIFTDARTPNGSELPHVIKTQPTAGRKAEVAPNKPPPPGKAPDFPMRLMLDALEQSFDETGWVSLATLGSVLRKLQPGFDSRDYGFKKLSDLVKGRNDLFVIAERATPGQAAKMMSLRLR